MNDILIRDVSLKDTEALLDIYSYYVEKTAITFEYATPSTEEFKDRITAITKRYPYLVLVADGKIRGYAYASAFHPRKAYEWCVEMTIYLHHDHHKKGYGKMLYEALEKALKEMGIINLYACIGYPEPEDEYLTKNSESFHAHLGYEKIGTFHNCGYKFGRWYHMIWMEKIIGEHKNDQLPIKNYKS
ncbi:MAG: GNAT family N-acetyltransferase [Lachnospiraceae bacterium]|nr:GNAT family N-acetyltransferase [Lachnospiraceae bacterium]